MHTFTHRFRIASLIGFAALLGLSPVSADVLPAHGRALSLRVLQQRAQACQQGAAPCEEAVTQLAFLRQIQGYVIDREHRDLVLIGPVDPAWPALHLQYLVIALRDAWHRYGERRGNTIYLSDPGVSIDPYPQMLARLQAVGQRLDALAGEPLRTGLEAWHHVCHLPQRVRVEGMPFDTRFAAVAVEVDYDLKRLSSQAIEVEGLTSLAARYLEDAKRALHEGRALRLSTMSRFWFTPRPLVVRADETAAVIDAEFALQVLTEEEYLNGRGQIVGQGMADPLAADFARAVSDAYSAIASRRALWRELDNLAWMVALARTLRYRDAPAAAGLEIDWLLDAFTVPKTDVPRTIPGHSNVHTYEYGHAVAQGYVTGSLTLPSCGGVTFAVKVDSNSFIPPDDAVLAVKDQVYRSRPNDEVLYWDF